MVKIYAPPGFSIRKVNIELINAKPRKFAAKIYYNKGPLKVPFPKWKFLKAGVWAWDIVKRGRDKKGVYVELKPETKR